MAAAGLHVFDILAQAVAQEGTDTCFALLGDGNMNFATRLAEAGVRHVYVRHEHCAVAAAMAFARKTGQVGLATVTCGPGLTQLTTALPAAVRARIPLVVIAGEAPMAAGWYNQAIDQAPFVTAAGAEYVPVHVAARLPLAVRDAFLRARMTRRPVVVGVPMDLQGAGWTGPEALPAPSAQLAPQMAPIPPHPGDLARAAALIEQAGRIVVMAGLGVAEAGAADACRALARHLDAPLATTLPARGLFAGDPFSIGVAGGFASDMAREVLGQADLILAIGCSLASHNADGGRLWPRAQVLQIDVDPQAVVQGRVAAQAHLRADARLAADALLAATPARPAAWCTDDLAQRIATTPFDAAIWPPEPGLHDPRAAVAAFEAHLPPDWQIVNSSGHCSHFTAHMPSRPYARFLTIREFGAIGNGLSFAMGVAAACPDQKVVLFDGDGSILMHVQELETIARHRMNILIVVLNDGAYGSEIHKLRSEGLDDAGAVFGRTDLASVARGFGLGGARISDLADLPALIDAFGRSGGGALWDVPISDRVASPLMRRAHPPKAT